MNYLKLFEAYFDESKTWEEVNIHDYHLFSRSHQKKENHDYSEELDIFENALGNLYQRDEDDFNNNQYRVHLGALDIHLVRRKIDIIVKAFEDDWYTIMKGKYHYYEDTDYSEQDFFIVDSLEGVDDWIQANL